MELRRLLFERQIKQNALVRTARSFGYGITISVIAKIVNNRRRASSREREALRVALEEYGVVKSVIGRIDELKEP